MISVFRSLIMITLLGYLGSCSSGNTNLIPANLDHALGLVDSTAVAGEMLKWISIYADAPGYEPVAAQGEGVTCVDDVGRFLEVLEYEIIHNQRQELLPVAVGMVRYLFYLNRDDGLWYNFIFEDGSINKEYRTSVASFGWWAVRGLRGLGAGYRIFVSQPKYESLTKQIAYRFSLSQTHLDALFLNYPQYKTMDDGSERPVWNLEFAPDKSSELLLALAGMHGLAGFDYSKEIQYLAEALIGWQYTGEEETYKGMFYCWQNTWHSWGNNQALALIKAYSIIGDEKYLSSVKLWADQFVPNLIQNNFPAEIRHDSLGNWEVNDYSQIAYGINSTYRGMQALAEITGSPEYQQRAEQVFSWFKGDNVARIQMYDPASGRCFDGINGVDKVNYNSGAESTIECLMAIQTRAGW